MAPPVLTEELESGIQLVTLNRPDKLNAMSLDLVEALGAALDTLGRDRACRVIILTGAGRGFCSGHDLGEMRDGHPGLGGLGTVRGALAVQRAFSALTLKVRRTSKPVIAAVNGPAAGGGLALALAADTRLCAESARFNAAFVRLGIAGTDVGVSYLLPKIVGPTAGFEMMLSGRLVDADEALRIGLVLRVVPDGRVVNAALEIAHAIVANSPLGVEMTKGVMWQTSTPRTWRRRSNSRTAPRSCAPKPAITARRSSHSWRSEHRTSRTRRSTPPAGHASAWPSSRPLRRGTS
jgi:enoyl-CoA hydratase